MQGRSIAPSQAHPRALRAAPLTRCNSLQSMLQIQNLKAGFPCLQGRTAQVERSFRPTLRGPLHPLSIVAFFSLIFRSAPRKTKPKAASPQNPKPQKTQRGGRALLRPTTDRNPDQKPNQTDRPTDRPTDRTQYRTRAGSRHQTVPLNSHVCVGPLFSHVTCSRRAQGSNLSTLVARAIRDPKRAVGGSRWIPDRKIDHFMGLFFPVPSRVVCARVC